MKERDNGRLGSSVKIVDAILREITSLKPVSECNKAKLLHVMSVVVQAWLDLRGIGKIKETANHHNSTKAESLLPVD